MKHDLLTAANQMGGRTGSGQQQVAVVLLVCSNSCCCDHVFLFDKAVVIAALDSTEHFHS